MNRRTFIGAISVVGTSFAGCTDQLGALGESNDASPSDTLTPAGTVTPEKNITPYEELTAEGKELFEQVYESGAIVKTAEDLPYPLVVVEYIRYNGTVYAVSRGRGTIAERTLRFKIVQQSTVDQSKLVAYENLSADAKEVFDQLLRNGRYSVRGEPLPSQPPEYVKHHGTYYHVWKITGDVRAVRLSISEAESADFGSTP